MLRPIADERAEPCAGRRKDLCPIPYKEGVWDDKTLIRDVHELVLTPDALRYYDKLYGKRREVADDVRAEAGEC